MDRVRLRRLNGREVELRGLAAMQWSEALKLEQKNPRVYSYLLELRAWSRIAPGHAREMRRVGGFVFWVATHKSVRLLYTTENSSVVVFWLSGLLRPHAASNLSSALRH